MNLSQLIQTGFCNGIDNKSFALYSSENSLIEEHELNRTDSGVKKKDITSKKFRNGIDNKSFALDASETSLAEEHELNREKNEEEEEDITYKEEPETKPEEEIPPVSFLSLFRYSSVCDKFLIGIATVVALVSGAVKPCERTLNGFMIDQFIEFDGYKGTQTGNETTNNTMTREDFIANTTELCMYHALLALFSFVAKYLLVSCFSVAAANQAFRIRCRFMESVLKQDIAWFDTHQTGDLATRITGDLTRIQDGLGEKVGICLHVVSSILLCVGVSMYFSWKLTLIILCISPVLIVVTVSSLKIQASVSRGEADAYGNAGAVAEEVLSSIRTVVAFDGQKNEIKRYETCLLPAYRKGVLRAMLTAINFAVTWFCVFAGVATSFWVGVKFIVESKDQSEPQFTGGNITIVFFNIMFAAIQVGHTVPLCEAFALARGAAAKIYSIIDRVPPIDSGSNVGLRPSLMKGHIRLTDVHFNYPTRPTVPVLRGLNLEARPGETVALVGSSGCGKSTIVQLLLRFYDVNSGSVELDGISVKKLHLGWMRDQMGLVGQEPVLFATTIEENIRMGRRDATPEDIVSAAKTANAHDFIQGLPQKYGTLVGERGIQLSGGQKQRIAIARALVRNPQILLLDEATSALDTESESVVQAALDQARRGRTTLVVAHCLSTIRTADKIVVLDKGVVKETGTHDELMQWKNGLYYQLVVAQTKDKVVNEEEGDDEDIPELERRTSQLSLGSEFPENAFQCRVADRKISTISRKLSTASREGKEIKEEENLPKLPRKRLLEFSAHEWYYVLAGLISTLLSSVHFAAFSIIIGEILGYLSQSTDVILEKTQFFCLIYVGMAVTSTIFNFAQIFMFSVAVEKLAFRLRKMIFANIITQDINFFDSSENSVGSLCSRLNSDATAIHGATGSRISTALQALSLMVVNIFIGFFFNWKLGLVSVTYIPLVLLCTVLESRLVSSHKHNENQVVENASKVATEAIENIRTVASLHQEEIFYNQYCSVLLELHKKSFKKSHVRGLAYTFANGISTLSCLATLYYGSVMIARAEVEYADVLKVMNGVVIGAQMAGLAAAFTADYEKARVAVIRIFGLLDNRPALDSYTQQGFVQSSINSSVHYSNVHFRYPSRPSVRVLRGLEAVIEAGKTVALVGTSGCGKSTCIQLLERFYDPNKGTVKVDSRDVRNLNVASHRSRLALVTQEPVLFNRSIAENIAYGDNTKQLNMAEIIDAARQANIHGFITSLPQGYDTTVGNKGLQLSGGQKQRISIARALIRNPKILLLDEATSALDSECEKVVQEALDAARRGRTSLIIAHRLTTIQNADAILVMHRGNIVERGTHEELINKKGFYYRLHNVQS